MAEPGLMTAEAPGAAPATGFNPRLAPFVVFLGKAAQAMRRHKAAHRKLWLEAAAELYALEDDALDAMARDMSILGDGPRAVEMAEYLAEIFPANARAHFRLAHARQSVGDARGALAPLRRSIALNPDLSHARNNLAAALMSLDGPAEEILSLLEAAAAADPSQAEPWINLATQKLRVFDLDYALMAGERAVALAPNSALACNNYFQALKEAKRWDEAEPLIDRAVALSGGEAVYCLNRGLLHLLRGKYASGWEGFESRWAINPEKLQARPVVGGQPWRGEPLAGKTLLLWGEEGNGDVIQFSRFAPRLAEQVHAQGGRLIWNSFPQFGDLLARSLGHHVDGYVTGGIPLLPPFDYEISLLNLPRLFGIDDETLGAPSPYLKADPALREQWRQRLASDRGLKVGLAWTGSPEQPRNPFRSVDLARYAAHLGGLKGVSFYSLQVGGGDVVRAAQIKGFDIVDPTDTFATYDDTAAFVDNLDLVITICTSVAHLAGALAKPTWILLDVNAHWVWRLDRPDSLWYPTVRLYRQRRFGDWTPVFDDVARDLADLAGGRQSDAD